MTKFVWLRGTILRKQSFPTSLKVRLHYEYMKRFKNPSPYFGFRDPINQPFNSFYFWGSPLCDFVPPVDCRLLVGYEWPAVTGKIQHRGPYGNEHVWISVPNINYYYEHKNITHTYRIFCEEIQTWAYASITAAFLFHPFLYSRSKDRSLWNEVNIQLGLRKTMQAAPEKAPTGELWWFCWFWWLKAKKGHF